MPIKVAVLGASAGAAAQELAAAGVGEVLDGRAMPRSSRTRPTRYALALAQRHRRRRRRRSSLLPHTYQTRDFAPLLAARLRMPLITDVTGITGTGRRRDVHAADVPGQAGRARCSRRATAPCFVTFQIGAFRADAVAEGRRRRR